MACSAARRKRGAPSKADERAPLLDKMVNLLITNAAWKPWRAATIVAREHSTTTESVKALQLWLTQALRENGDQLLARARAAKAWLAGAAEARRGRSPVAHPKASPALCKTRTTNLDAGSAAMRDWAEMNAGSAAMRDWAEMNAGSAARGVRNELDAEARARRAPGNDLHTACACREQLRAVLRP
jgi:hypothetical protein